LKRNEETRIGVALCHCGKNIAGGVDIDALVEFTQTIDGVVSVSENRFSCSEEGQTYIQDIITKNRLNRFVVAACDPALHLATFQRCGEKVGLDPAFMTLVNIRKWTMHGSPAKVDPSEALEKSKALISRAVKRIRLKRVIPKVAVRAEQACLVIGGGIAGVEAALNLADKGYKVYLVERLPTIGGKMALLYKVFPTNDCAPCILAPKTAYANAHENITLITNAEITAVEGYIGNFTVTLVQKPRYVDEHKCTGCRNCIEKCPSTVPNEYAANMGQRKAIHIPYPQAIPLKAFIDPEHCLYLQKGVCRVCETVCPTKAIDFAQKPQQITLTVGAIIVATGFDEYNPAAKVEYGYGRYGNVITQFQLARLLDIDGPTKGTLLRPTDGKPPRTIVMVQCVGSRDERANPYCSNVCCMSALKHAQIIKEMALPQSEVYICYLDMRTTGKGYEEYYQRTRGLGITFIHGRPSEVIEDPDTSNLRLRVEDAYLGENVNLEAELVVLSCAIVPSQGTEALSKILGIPLDENGFFKEMHPKLRPVETAIRGIYICGCAQGPKDIPNAIVQADAAASYADSELRKGEILLPQYIVQAGQRS